MGIFAKIKGLIGIPNWSSGTVKNLVIDSNGNVFQKDESGGLDDGTTDLIALSWDLSTGKWVEREGVRIEDDGKILLNKDNTTDPSLHIVKSTNGVAVLIDYTGVNNYIELKTAGNPDYTFGKSAVLFYQELFIQNQKAINFKEASVNGTNYIAIKAPDSIASNFTLKLPNADGTNGQVLGTDGSGNLSFIDAGGGGYWDSTVIQDNEQTVTSSTTLVDTDLTIALESGFTYYFEAWLLADTNSVSNYMDYTIAFTGTSTFGRFNYGSISKPMEINRDTTLGTEVNLGVVPIGTNFKIYGVVKTTSTGDLKFQFAQNYSDPNPVYLRVGSSLSIKKVI